MWVTTRTLSIIHGNGSVLATEYVLRGDTLSEAEYEAAQVINMGHVSNPDRYKTYDITDDNRLWWNVGGALSENKDGYVAKDGEWIGDVKRYGNIRLKVYRVVYSSGFGVFDASYYYYLVTADGKHVYRFYGQANKFYYYWSTIEGKKCEDWKKM